MQELTPINSNKSDIVQLSSKTHTDIKSYRDFKDFDQKWEMINSS